MKEQTIGLFYNAGFDSLIGYWPKKAINGKYLKKDDFILMLDADEKLCGFNLLNASKTLKTKIYPGINSDNAELLIELTNVFKKYGYEINDFNKKLQFTIGKICERKPHPNSENLSICQVEVEKDKIEQIICGAENCEEGLFVVVANIGAIMPSLLQILPSELRGEVSNGMLCSERELGLETTQVEKKIMILSSNENKIGTSFWKDYYNG